MDEAATKSMMRKLHKGLAGNTLPLNVDTKVLYMDINQLLHRSKQ